MRAVLLALIGLLFAPLAVAQPYATPKALLEAAYSPYFTEEFPDDPHALYSSRLKALWASADRESEDEVGAVNFDPFINAQDYQIENLVIGEEIALGDGRMTVPVGFLNMGEPQALDFTLVREGGGWLVDDIAATTPGYEFQLSELLSAQ